MTGGEVQLAEHEKDISDHIELKAVRLRARKVIELIEKGGNESRAAVPPAHLHMGKVPVADDRLHILIIESRLLRKESRLDRKDVHVASELLQVVDPVHLLIINEADLARMEQKVRVVDVAVDFTAANPDHLDLILPVQELLVPVLRVNELMLQRDRNQSEYIFLKRCAGADRHRIFLYNVHKLPLSCYAHIVAREFMRVTLNENIMQ